jgi:hypothetical protein
MYQMDLTVGFCSKYLQYFKYTSVSVFDSPVLQQTGCILLCYVSAECWIDIFLPDYCFIVEAVNLIVDKECMVVWEVTNKYVLQWF